MNSLQIEINDTQAAAPEYEKAAYYDDEEVKEVLPEIDPENPFRFCGKRLPCGHLCKGVAEESACLPCLKPACIERELEKSTESDEEMNNDADDDFFAPQNTRGSICQMVKGKPIGMNAAENELGGICFTSELGEEPCVKLTCGHVFHANCLLQMLMHRWTTLRVTFGFLDCPSCKSPIRIDYSVPLLEDALEAMYRIKCDIQGRAVAMAMNEGLDLEGRVVTPGDHFYGKLEEFAMHNCTFYECNKCGDFYFGGMQDCEAALAAEDKTKKEDLLCKTCTEKELGLGQTMCEKHGNEFIDYKCMYCCSIALFICCKGRYYFCTPCHNDIMNGGKHKAQSECTGGPQCALGIASHPAASDDPKASAFSLGCSLCRSEKLGIVADNQAAGNGVNLEVRDDMKKRFDHVQGHDIGREMHVQRGP